jgi:hypothetical protein
VFSIHICALTSSLRKMLCRSSMSGDFSMYVQVFSAPLRCAVI